MALLLLTLLIYLHLDLELGVLVILLGDHPGVLGQLLLDDVVYLVLGQTLLGGTLRQVLELAELSILYHLSITVLVMHRGLWLGQNHVGQHFVFLGFLRLRLVQDVTLLFGQTGGGTPQGFEGGLTVVLVGDILLEEEQLGVDPLLRRGQKHVVGVDELPIVYVRQPFFRVVPLGEGD